MHQLRYVFYLFAVFLAEILAYPKQKHNGENRRQNGCAGLIQPDSVKTQSPQPAKAEYREHQSDAHGQNGGR